MDLKPIGDNTNWGQASAIINSNNQAVNSEMKKLSLSTVRFKGFFNTLESLKSANPKPTIGDYAWVGTVYPGLVYDVIVRGVWRATTNVPPAGSVNLADYPKKNELIVVAEVDPSTPPAFNGQMHYNEKDKRMFIGAK